MRKRFKRLRPNLTPTTAAAIVFLLIGTGVIVYLADTAEEVLFNLSIELVSIAVTVLVIERLNKQQAEQARREEVIQQIASLSNDFALEAVRLSQLRGWLRDGSLNGANLGGAKLQGADLFAANLLEEIATWLPLPTASSKTFFAVFESRTSLARYQTTA